MRTSRVGKIALFASVVTVSFSMWASPGFAAPNGGGGADNGVPNGASVHASDKLPIWTTPRVSCGGNNPIGSPTIGSVVIKADPDTITAEVTVKDGIPNFSYEFQLLQVPSSRFGCVGPPNAILTTNAQGNGNVHITQRRFADTTGAWILAFPPRADNVISSVYTFGAK